jgi:glycosyltransferase involved in cell wall biosynthesis
MLVCGFSYEQMKRNVTLTNSNWTAKKFREAYGVAPETVYPPVLGSFPEVSWGEREIGFVCIGKFLPWKGFEEIIQIVKRTRSRVKDIHLHLIGTADQGAYHKRLLRLAQKAHWIHISENVSRQELLQLITSHSYGIHRMIKEPFGMAVAEMIWGGCIVFVPRGGGPEEIVGADDRLLFGSIDEAVAKIIRVINNNPEQASLREYLNLRKDLFSKERFVRQIQEIAARFMNDKDTHLLT